MKSVLNKYGYRLTCAALFSWSIVLSFMFCGSMWTAILTKLQNWGVNIHAFTATTFVLVIFIAFAGSIVHCVVLLIPAFRRVAQPSLSSHIAAGALIYLSTGAIITLKANSSPIVRTINGMFLK